VDYGTRYVQETINNTYHEAIKCHCTKHLLEINPFVGCIHNWPDKFLNKVRTTIDKGDVEVLLDNSNNQEPGSNSVEELQTVNEEEIDTVMLQDRPAIRTAQRDVDEGLYGARFAEQWSSS